ncbi:hypothetical protein GCM10023189_48100 [Nibrella saemangeumensis]|uniref:Uncharacterized protein n=1 Tax=Nibrella saemangeumensis TaxID=1084526 RepID=A0ABP8NIX1_9BACT
MKRFSVVYRLKEQYYHIPCSTYIKATMLLRKAHSTPFGKPVGIYDAKTELFQWGPLQQHLYNTLSLGEQGRQGSAIINQVQVLRQQDERLARPDEIPLGLY